MPESKLAQTTDAAYNLGRLFAVFDYLQYKYHGPEKKGAGIVERYYGTASSAPASTFPILFRLARHHLGKLKKGDETSRMTAKSIEKRIGEIVGLFEADSPGNPPVLPRILRLEEQGRFAFGFYQQRAIRRNDDKDQADNNTDSPPVES